MISFNKPIAIVRKAKILGLLWVLMGTAKHVGIVWVQVVSMETLPTRMFPILTTIIQVLPTGMLPILTSMMQGALGQFNLEFVKDQRDSAKG